MFRKLNFLIVLASVSVTLIIGFQLFWLISLYKEQKDRFRTDVKNSLIETVVANKLSATLMNDKAGISKTISDKLAKTILTGDKEKFKKDIKSLSKQYGYGDSNSLDTATVVVQINEKELVNEGDDLSHFKKLMNVALNKRDIDIPFEMAIVKDSTEVIKSSVAAGQFNKMFKVTVSELNTHLFGTQLPTQQTGIAAGFENVAFFFLRKMMWLLILTAILIPLFIYSYVQVIVTFSRQKKMAEIRNDFINNMTHELKTPISSASVAMQLIADRNITDTAKEEYLGIAKSELNRLNTLVEKVLNMAAFDKNEIRIADESIPVKPLITEVINSLKPVIETKRGSIQVEVIPDNLILQGDHVHLKNVLYNLIDNAFKYNDKPEPSISINAKEEAERIVLEVADNGNGIQPEYIDKVFDKFFRVPQGDMHNVKGYGLGLSYVKAIIELHGGTITATSALNEGSIFTIVLPKS
ncbi:MAG: HAMP domain-containing histidine kinase [Sphingobacteriales bacterium]|nr:MAG: HAMP domain-containing histidine kinase [Sphingobacteriales bacterium]